MPRRACCLFTILLAGPAAAADLPPGAALRLGDPRFRAGGPVAELVFSADGTELVSHVPGPGGDRVTVWDAATGELLRSGVPPRVAGARVRWGASSVPGTDLGVVIGPDGTAVVRDFAAKQDRAKLAGHAAKVTAVAASPDGKRLATGSADGLIRTWDATTFRPLSVPSGHLGPVLTVEVSPDGRLALTTGADRSVRVWEIATGREVRAFPLDDPGAATFAAGGLGVKLRTADGVRVRDLVTGVELVPNEPVPVDPFAAVRALAGACVAVSPDGRAVAVGRPGGGLDLVEALTFGVRRRLTAGVCRDAAFTPDGGRLLTAGPGEGVLVWPVRVRDVPLTQELRAETSAAKLWDRLGAADAAAAYGAMARLAADPPAAAKMARLRLGSGAFANPLTEARAVELLESLATPDARGLLRELADAGAVSAGRALARLGEPRPFGGDIRTTGATVP